MNTLDLKFAALAAIMALALSGAVLAAGAPLLTEGATGSGPVVLPA